MIKGNVCTERACVAYMGNGLPDVPLDNALSNQIDQTSILDQS